MSCHGKFFFRIFIKHFIEIDHSFFPGIHYPDHIPGCDTFRCDPVPGLHDFPSPGPFELIIVGMKLAESIRDLSDRFDLSVFYPADQADDPLLGDDQTGKVYPFAATFCPGRGQALADLFVVVKCQVFQPFNDRVP